jgi:hypothetical protein
MTTVNWKLGGECAATNASKSCRSGQGDESCSVRGWAGGLWSASGDTYLVGDGTSQEMTYEKGYFLESKKDKHDE